MKNRRLKQMKSVKVCVCMRGERNSSEERCEMRNSEPWRYVSVHGHWWFLLKNRWFQSTQTQHNKCWYFIGHILRKCCQQKKNLFVWPNSPLDGAKSSLSAEVELHRKGATPEDLRGKYRWNTGDTYYDYYIAVLNISQYHNDRIVT